LNSDIFKNYIFNKEELEKIKVDITFNDTNNITQMIDQTQLAVEFTKKHLKQNPEMGYLIRIIKRLLQIKNLNNSFNGN
jgi:DNA polymerase sigma